MTDSYYTGRLCAYAKFSGRTTAVRDMLRDHRIGVSDAVEILTDALDELAREAPFPPATAPQPLSPVPADPSAAPQGAASSSQEDRLHPVDPITGLRIYNPGGSRTVEIDA